MRIILFFLYSENLQTEGKVVELELLFVLYLLSYKNIFISFRPIVQLVERAAHNGFVVGSNPARPILNLDYCYCTWTLILKLTKS